MVGAIDFGGADGDPLLAGGLLQHVLGVFGRGDFVVVPVNDQAAGGARAEEREIVQASGRCDGDEALEVRATHQHLHGDPAAEGEACQPDFRRVRVVGVEPVEGGGGVGEFSHAVVEHALGITDAAEVEAEYREAHAHEGFEQAVGHLVVHGTAVQRVRVQDDGNRGFRVLLGEVLAFEAAGRALEIHVGHGWAPY